MPVAELTCNWVKFMAPVRFAPSRMAPVRFAPSRIAPVRFAL